MNTIKPEDVWLDHCFVNLPRYLRMVQKKLISGNLTIVIPVNPDTVSGVTSGWSGSGCTMLVGAGRAGR